jgi:hypothetical protein
LKEKSERIEGGRFWISGKRAGGYGQNNHLLPPSLTTQNAGDTEADRGRGKGAGDLVHGDGREVGRNEEEVEGNRFRSLPRAGVLWRGGSTAAGGDRLWWSAVAVLGGLGGREAWLGWCVARWGAGLALLKERKGDSNEDI